MRTCEYGNGWKAGRLAYVALRHRLYVSGWSLSVDLQKIRARPLRGDCVSVVYEDNKPVSVAMVMEGDSTIMTFTRKSMRRKGYGREAVKGLKKAAGKGRQLHGNHAGAKGSVEFFQAVKML